MPQALLNIPDAKAAVEKEWEKVEKNPASQSMKQGIRAEKVYFASLMDLCHRENSELEPQCQKCKGRVVLRGDIAKYDSGSCAVFTEQGSSASQPQKSWTLFQGFQDVLDKQRTQYQLTPKSKWKMPHRH